MRWTHAHSSAGVMKVVRWSSSDFATTKRPGDGDYERTKVLIQAIQACPPGNDGDGPMWRYRLPLWPTCNALAFSICCGKIPPHGGWPLNAPDCRLCNVTFVDVCLLTSICSL